MKNPWKRLAIIMAIIWMTAILFLIWFFGQEPSTDIASMLHRLIE